MIGEHDETIMAKKILYKIKAYHCPRCGSGTDPERDYCDYCGRDLRLRSKNEKDRQFRLLVDCHDYIYFDDISRIEFEERPQMIDATTLENTRRTIIASNPEENFTIWLPISRRNKEIAEMPYQGIKDVRFEHLGMDIGYQMQAYVSEVEHQIYAIDELSMMKIRFIGCSAPIIGGAIPKEVLEVMRCPNCGAPIESRYGTCDYCSGYTEVEW